MHGRRSRSFIGWSAALGALLLGVPAWGAGDPAPGAATAQTVKLPDGPGSVRGLADSPSVNVFSGQLGYRVPLELPEGIAGFGPKLSLAYSGELGNGPLGVGWALPQASIRRATRQGVPAYTAADELELLGVGGGGRLVALPDGTWRVEGQGHSIKVERDGDGYAVTESGGVRFRLGITAAGRQADGARVAGWFVEEVLHPNGQAVTFQYTQHQGQQYLSEVKWGPGTAFRAEFIHEPRPDVTVSYRTGFAVQTAQRLSQVRVHAFGEVLRVYSLGYEQSRALSRLERVTMLGRGSVGQLPTLTFQYAPAQEPTSVQVEPASGWLLSTTGTSFLDVDGDGMADLVRLGTSGHQWRKGTGAGFGPARTLAGASGAQLSSARFLDVDGDSKPELVRSFSEAWQVNTLQGESLGSTASKWHGTDALALFSTSTFLADLNGDGRVDVVRTGSESLSVRWNRVSCPGAPATQTPCLNAAVSRPAVDGVALLPGPNARFHEVNGDGLADVVQLLTGSYKVYLGRGDGTFAAAGSFLYPWGDGTNTANVKLADLDRDGLMDLVHVLGGYVHWYRGKAGGGVEATATRLVPPSADAASTVVALADVNGNGSEDVVWSGPTGMWAMDLAGPTTAGMLVGLDNGLGKTVTLQYASSAQLSVAAESTPNPWTRKLPVSVPVPVRVEVDPGAGGPVRAVEYTVRDGFWDGQERRFGGFLVGGMTTPGATPATTLYQETRYHAGLGMDRALRGAPLEVRTQDGAGQLFTVETSEYEARPVEGLPDTALLRRAALLEQRTLHHEGVSSPLVTKTTYAYDARVRPIREERFGRLDLEGDERFTTRVWASDDTLWVQDVLCEEQVREADGTLVAHTRNFYGDATQVFTWTDPADCRAGRLARETHGFLADATNPRWVLRSATEYDAWDNPVRTYSLGSWRALSYDSHHLYPTEERISPQAGQTLSWGMTWDDVLGRPTAMTDPTGATTHLSYDSLGRPSTLALGTQPPHLRFVYDWSAPRPRTYTYSFDGAEDALAGSWTGAWQDGGPWRETVAVTNGLGEELYSATRLSADRWIVSGWRERDARGLVVYAADSFHADGALPTARPTSAVGQVLTHDARGRPVTQTLPTLALRSMAYRAFEATESVQDLAPVTTRRDGLGRILRTERQVGTVLEAVDAAYDAADRLLTVSLQGGAATHAFTYDTLGRLVAANDPDIGQRILRYTDSGRLTHHTNGANQTRQFIYDDAGRLVRTEGEDGSAFVYHYDVAQDGGTTGRTASRLAWVEEPRGSVHFTYDAAGRVVARRRIIDGLSSEESTVFSPSGLTLATTVDGVRVDNAYDAAGRPVRAGSYWEALTLDAAGRVMEERYGNGVRQSYQRDAMGLASRVQTLRGTGAALYDVTLTRNAYGAPATVSDVDGVGLNHSAIFNYDAAARLTDAVIGAELLPDGMLKQGPDSFRFDYAYDGLQNLLQRQATGPRALGLLTGTYHHGERGFGPRQLTRVESPGGDTLLDYDAAGRVVRQGARTLEYNGLDQLVGVTMPGPGGTPALVQHGYGYDGQRTLTQGAAGETQYWFSPQLTQRTPTTRERYVKLGDRTLARITQTATGATGPLADFGGPRGAALDGAVARGLTGTVAGALVLLLLSVFLPRTSTRTRGPRLVAGLVAVALLGAACEPGVRASQRALQHAALVEVASTLYFHTGVSAGPALITRADGSVFEERRYEPFGAPIDAYRELVGGGGVVGNVDHQQEPLNTLNKLTDAHTGWSDHGARWLAPEMAQWLTPDPPVKAPDEDFLLAPWDLNPYQYVRQNPVLYWDPDGKDAEFAAKAREFGVGFLSGLAQSVGAPRLPVDLPIENQYGQIAGELVGGIAQLVLADAMGGAGGALAVAGVVGTPATAGVSLGAVAAGSAMMAGAVVVGVNGTVHIANATSRFMALQKKGGGSDNPAPGGGGGGGGGGRSPHRDKPRIDDGNLKEGWIHIDARHVTGNHPAGHGDLFAPGTTRQQISKAAEDVVKYGTRKSNPRTQLQTFEMKTTVNGQKDLIRVIVDSDDGNRVISAFPVRGTTNHVPTPAGTPPATP
ncbi:FG-GAP-like repeat-containing protein [Corallococcus interemptor]|uniref:FG-GAP-like repeat-containing protein n=1 Tax=Corallococcus interemptor TaxID=2316720 RepID=UPI0035D51D2F